MKEEVRGAYRTLLRLRHREKAFIYGRFCVKSRARDRFVYERRLGGRVYLADCNLGETPCREYPLKRKRKLVYDTDSAVMTGGSAAYRKKRGMLAGYEARIWRLSE